MAKKNPITQIFLGFEVAGLIYPPDKPPHKAIEAIDRAVREVLFPDIKESLLPSSKAE